MSPPEPDAVAGVRGFLIFGAAGLLWALPLEDVVEIAAARSPTPVPEAPAVDGILALRGRMVAVLDLRRRLGLAATAAGRPRLLVVRDGDDRAALVVDSVARVVPEAVLSAGAPPDCPERIRGAVRGTIETVEGRAAVIGARSLLEIVK